MPTKLRPARSLLALALVINLVAATAPGPALGGQQALASEAARATTTLGAAHIAPAAPAAPAAATTDAGPRSPDYDRGPSLRTGLLSGRSTAIRTEPDTSTATLIPEWIDRPKTDVPEPKARAVSTDQATSGKSGASPSSFRGRNHVWIPALGVNRSISFFACTSKAYPGDRVYRWGCAGGNNLYLFGHAHSVFKPLHDAYVRGRLKKGMKLYYANANGKVSTYAVAWWKVTTPDKSAWAYAGQGRPSVTLQTCVGANSQYRLIVRLLKVS
jgi:sortase (surface protein transpeptidase)